MPFPRPADRPTAAMLRFPSVTATLSAGAPGLGKAWENDFLGPLPRQPPRAALPWSIRHMHDATLDYYDANAEAFAASTRALAFTSTQSRFLDRLPPAASVLDLGCGSGRDARFFLERGCRVTAMDGCGRMCRLASDFAGIPVRHMRFKDLRDTSAYDGVWACASLLHLPRTQLAAALARVRAALKPGGVLYASFKYGTFEGMRGGRYYTDFTEDTFAEYLRSERLGLTPEETWISADIRPERRDERWLNMFLR